MKKIYALTLLFGLLISQFNAQQHRSCGTEQHMLYLEQQNPNLRADMEAYEQNILKWISKNQNNLQKTPSVITIPVVVHVVYKNTSENISDAQIQSQIDILNEDFRRLNADASNTPAPFAAVAADAQIEFCLAQRDPNGQATTGIVRVSTTDPVFSPVQISGTVGADDIKYSGQGGDDAWDVTKYFNFWVCDLRAGSYGGYDLLGYGEFPTGSPSNTYGQACDYRAFGNTGTVQSPFNLGRTSTHEVGHCLNLFHIWGDAFCGSDQVNDTPTHEQENYNCPSYPFVTSCNGGNGPNGEMFMNYMDYVNDNCMNMFSQGQATRMQAVLNTPPYNALQNSDGCLPVNLSPLDASISDIESPSGSICNSTFTPQVTIKNLGSSTLTSATIKYKVDAGTPSSYSWSGSLATNATASVTLPAVTASAGAHTFEAYTESPNGGTDANTNNDASTSSFTVTSGSGVSLPITEGFESTTFPPTGWTLNNPDANKTWARTTLASKTGVASAFMDNINYPVNGERDDLIGPIFTGSTPMLNFDVAYSLYTNPTSGAYSDTLIVYFSNDCGVSWTEVYKKYGTALTTATPPFTTSTFIPLSSQWRNESVDLTPYMSGASGMIKFVNVCDFENQLYLDNVSITGTTGNSARFTTSEVKVYPNPMQHLFYVEGQNIRQIQILDMLGHIVSTTSSVSPLNTFDMSSMAKGVYFVNVVLNNGNKQSFKIFKP